jgi:glycosyltransferase 2 family protein
VPQSVAGSERSPAVRGRYRIVLWTIQIGAVIALCWLMFRNIDISSLSRALQRVQYPLLVVSSITLIIERLIRPCRLGILLGPLTPLTAVLPAQSVAQLVNLILPMRSGEVVLVVLLRKLAQVAASYAISIIMIDRLLDVIAVLILFALALFFVPSLPASVEAGAMALATASLLAIGIFAAVVAGRHHVTKLFDEIGRRRFPDRREKWLTYIERIIEGLAVLFNPRRLALAVLLTVLTWTAAVCSAWLILIAVWPDGTLTSAALSVSLAAIGVTIISVPAGIGVAHAGLALGVMLSGAKQEVALGFAILYYFFALVTTAAIGFVSLRVCQRSGLASWQVVRRIQPEVNQLNA